MSRTWRTRTGRLPSIIAALGAVATLVFAAACSGPGGDGASSGSASQHYTQSDIDAALDKPAEITFWAWGPQYPGVVDAFMKAHPKVKVNLLSEGSSNDEYTKLQNVLKAGSGVPDLVQIEFAAMPQFALGGSLVDMNAYGVGSMKDKFSASCWAGSQVNGALYGLPQDAGPLAMFYRKDVFDQYGLQIPKTWDQYVAAAKQLKADDPTKYITADAGDPAATNALIWQAGGRPYTVNGENISVNLAVPGATTWADTWQPLIDGNLVDTATAAFTPDWNAGLANGKYATLITGAWAAGTLQRRIPGATGKWRVAPLPQYKEGDTASAQVGGSLSAVTTNSQNKLVATGLAQFIAADAQAAKIWVDQGGFPCTSATLASSAWLNAAVPYFGGQQVNQIFGASAANVGPGWQFLPFQAYANSVFADTVGQAYVKRTDLKTGLMNWQQTIVSYGKNQGFTVS